MIRHARHNQGRHDPGQQGESGQAMEGALKAAMVAGGGEAGGNRQEHERQRSDDGLGSLEQPGARLVGRNVGVGSHEPQERAVDPELDHGQQAETEQG